MIILYNNNNNINDSVSDNDNYKNKLKCYIKVT